MAKITPSEFLKKKIAPFSYGFRTHASFFLTNAADAAKENTRSG